MNAVRRWLSSLFGSSAEPAPPSPLGGDRRSGADRRSGEDRRTPGADWDGSERRTGTDRRSGQDRRRRDPS